MEIDRQIHEQILGKCCHEVANAGQWPQKCKCGLDMGGVSVAPVPEYSSDIGLSFELVEWLRGKGYEVRMESQTLNWLVTVFWETDLARTTRRHVAQDEADTLPEAICLAALSAQEQE